MNKSAPARTLQLFFLLLGFFSSSRTFGFEPVVRPIFSFICSLSLALIFEGFISCWVSGGHLDRRRLYTEGFMSLSFSFRSFSFFCVSFFL